MNFYQFHVGDYVTATRHLSWEEDAAFRRLLDTYYTTEKPLPVELRAVCRLVMAQTDSQREAVRVVLEEFFVQTPAGWTNKRADAEIAVMREKVQKQRDKANKRWHMPPKERGNAAAQKTDAAAQIIDADAMPPVPVPVPIDTHTRAQDPEHPTARTVEPEWRSWALAEVSGWTAEIVAVEAQRFSDHHAAKGTESDDWFASWRLWCRDPLTQKAHRVADKARAPPVTVPTRQHEETAAYLRQQEQHAAEGQTPEAKARIAELLARTKASLRAA